MTTNKPPIAAWAPSTALHKLASRHNNAPCILTDCPAEFNDVAMVRLSDYEALQAECENLRKHLQNLIDQTTPLEPVPGNPMWSRRIQLDEVIAERDSLRAECDALVEALEFYAKGEHFTPYDPDQWDTVSGEPLNLLHHDDGADGSAGFVENGSIAKAALASHHKQGGK